MAKNKNLKCDKTQDSKCEETQIVTKNQKLKMWHSSKTLGSLGMMTNVSWTSKTAQKVDLSIGATICTRQEIQCLLYIRFVCYW